MDKQGRKIVYRVSRKLYNQSEIGFMKEIIGEKSCMDLVRLVLHHVTSILMLLTMFIIIITYLVNYIVNVEKNYNYILARVTEQSTTIVNRVSSISVIKYAIYNNVSASLIGTNLSQPTILTANNTQVSYSDLTPYCKTNNVYLAPDITTANYIISGFSSGWFYFSDIFFIFCMVLLFLFIIFISLYPIKIYQIPFAIRSHKITRWAYLMRFKVFAYASFMVLTSFYHRYNLYDISSFNCLDCYGATKNCYLVDRMHFACTIIGAFLVAPWVLLFILNCFTDKAKYILIPVILVNAILLFALIVIANISLVWWIVQSRNAFLRTMHVLNYCVLIFSTILSFTCNRCKS